MLLESRALDAAKKAMPRPLRRALASRVEAAIDTYLTTAHFTEEFAVPCLDRPCRRVHENQASAEKDAISEGASVIERRYSGPWRPDPSWPPDDEVAFAPQRPPT